MNNVNRMSLSLHETFNLILDLTPELRKENIEFNLFWMVGDPGSGKTRGFESVVNEKNFGLLCYSPALERMEKFGGIPDLIWKDEEDGKKLNTVWSVPQMIHEINDASKKYEYLFVLFDDWHLCDEDLQSIGFEVFTYYSLNGHKIAPNVIFVLAGNETSAAGAKVSLTAIKNRCTLIYIKPDVNDWLRKYAIPKNINPIGISFFQNEANHDLFQEQESTSEPFGSARSWTSSFNLLTELEEKYKKINKPIPLKYIHAIFQGSVSSKGCQRFSNHYTIFKEIDVNEIYVKGIIKVPTNPVSRFCFSAALNYEFYRRFIECRHMEESDAKTEKDRICKIYASAIAEMEKSCPEIASMTLTNIGAIKENKELGLPSGLDAFAYILSQNLLSTELVRKLKEIRSVLN